MFQNKGSKAVDFLRGLGINSYVSSWKVREEMCETRSVGLENGFGRTVEVEEAEEAEEEEEEEEATGEEGTP